MSTSDRTGHMTAAEKDAKLDAVIDWLEGRNDTTRRVPRYPEAMHAYYHGRLHDPGTETQLRAYDDAYRREHQDPPLESRRSWRAWLALLGVAARAAWRALRAGPPL